MPSSRVSSSTSSATQQTSQQTPEQIATAIEAFVADHQEAAVLEDGKVLFDLRSAKYAVGTDHGRCTLQFWNDERNMVRRIIAATPRSGTLRLDSQPFGRTQTKLLELVSSSERRTPTSRHNARTRYMHVLERVLTREFPQWKLDGFRTAMDLERSFGPAYARGSLVQGNKAWAVIGVNAQESAATVDGILTLGILWLHHSREHAGGKRLYQGLRLVLPRGTAMLTLSRLAWMNTDTAQWELYELDETSEELAQRDPADTGNLLTRLVHHPDESAARERFSDAAKHILALVPDGQQERVEQRLRSSAELAFLLHGLEFARAKVRTSATSFSHEVAIFFGTEASETELTEANRNELSALVSDLFRRRRPFVVQPDFARRGKTPARRIGARSAVAAHSRLRSDDAQDIAGTNPQQDPLYRAAPERWLESVLLQDLSPLTRGLTAEAARPGNIHGQGLINDDVAGNFAAPANAVAVDEQASRTIPRLDPQHVYTQVPAIAGASDRGLLDLLGVTADGRLAVIELKADDDLHLALQGLDYWVRVRHHHLQTVDAATGLGEFQRHGYFRGVELSPLPPRLYLVAPALHIHPATETVLRYVSPRVEWNLLALDERWRQQIRVVWRKSSKPYTDKSERADEGLFRLG